MEHDDFNIWEDQEKPKWKGLVGLLIFAICLITLTSVAFAETRILTHGVLCESEKTLITTLRANMDKNPVKVNLDNTGCSFIRRPMVTDRSVVRRMKIGNYNVTIVRFIFNGKLVMYSWDEVKKIGSPI